MGRSRRATTPYLHKFIRINEEMQGVFDSSNLCGFTMLAGQLDFETRFIYFFVSTMILEEFSSLSPRQDYPRNEN